MKDMITFLGTYLRTHARILIPFLFTIVTFCIIFCLCNISIYPVLYAAVISASFCLCYFLFCFLKAWKEHKDLMIVCQDPRLHTDISNRSSGSANDYVNIIRALQEETDRLETDMNVRYNDMTDYYAAWAHQIKTPIASMRLNLQDKDDPDSHALQDDLMRIEQYVDMVMAFLRTETPGNDLVFMSFDSDKIIRECVRKLSSQFIRKHIRLIYEPTHMSILSDEKWLSFVVEQILSNAVKYTMQGSVTIQCEDDRIMITDTGIGIEPEDLPRVFERNYTGYNGRSCKKASGIGLYLCKRICTKLGHTITIASNPKEGTTVCIDVKRYPVTE